MFNYKVHKGSYLLWRKSKMTGLVDLVGWYGRTTAYRLARDFNEWFTSSAFYWVEPPPKCEYCHKFPSVILWQDKIAACKNCWKILLEGKES